MVTIIQRLIDKSIESFLMAIELYNKPTIRYRVEGFSMFICNAWELLLKARMIDAFGEISIYYKDNHERTLSLENCIQKVFTNKKAPLRINLEKIVELRNTSTHYITEEYEMVYVPLFQACVFNYNDKMRDYFGIDMSERVPSNFLTLSVSMKPLDVNVIRAKYPLEIADKLIATGQMISGLASESNSAFAIRVEQYNYITRDKSQATSSVHIDSTATEGVAILRQVQDPSNTHNLTMNKCLSMINHQIVSGGTCVKLNGEPILRFNSHHFMLFVKYFGMKTNPQLCYCYTPNKNPMYSYSIHAVTFIVAELQKDPENILTNIKSKLTKKK